MDVLLSHIKILYRTVQKINLYVNLFDHIADDSVKLDVAGLKIKLWHIKNVVMLIEDELDRL